VLFCLIIEPLLGQLFVLTENKKLMLMKNLTIAMACTFFLSLFTGCESPKTESMNIREISKNWQFRQNGQNEWLPATVPGTVHTDLLANGKIKDPFYRLNEHDVQWIDKVDWEYQTSFQVEKQLLENDQILLDFQGLDTYAEVILNSQKILESDNMFRQWEVNVKDILKEGENVLHILFRSPIREGIKKYDANGYIIPVSGNDLAEIGQVEGGKMVSIYTRKAGYHFGWDWGPRLVTSGIWRPVCLKAWKEARIKDIRYVLKSLSAEKASYTAIFEIESQDSRQANIRVENNGTLLAGKAVQLSPGTGIYEVDFEIVEPKLWWTNGLGEPYLYTLSGKLTAGKLKTSKDTKIGVRTLEFVREKDSRGTTFLFKLNGVPVFMKGANYIPNDMFLPRVTPEKYRNVIKTAKISNMNMLRVWGGGVYEEDLFYDLCDEAGILVWQDFMFACAMFPDDQAFLENVKQEAIDNVKRLRNHPCVALWCGNNEILVAWKNWGWEKAEMAKNPEVAASIWKGYADIFQNILPGVVHAYDPQRGYVDSSPSAGLGIVPDLINGDEHYWGVWWGKEPFETYATYIPRFMSEYGFQSFPEIATVKKYALPEDYDIYSDVMKSHQRSSIGNETIEYYLLKEYDKPKDFESFLYVNHILQAEGIKFGLEGHRRAAPFCMGSLYWQINDVWPVASWSSTDYYQKWKALQYYAKKSFEPLLVSPFIEGIELKVSVLNDFLQERKGKLHLSIIDFKGKVHRNYETEVTIPANSAQLVFAENQEKFLAGADPRKVLLVAEYLENDMVKSVNLLYFKPFKELDLPEPKVEHTLEKTENGYTIHLSTDVLARNIYMQAGDPEEFFSDNYFDLLPGQHVTIKFETSAGEKEVAAAFTIRTLKDAFPAKGGR
jgi:beta-mannosidase